jgi:hypothetical protein
VLQVTRRSYTLSDIANFETDLKVVAPEPLGTSDSGSVQSISVLPSASLKILLIKLKKALHVESAAEIQVTHDGRTFSNSESSQKLSDLGLQSGDQIEIRIKAV